VVVQEGLPIVFLTKIAPNVDAVGHTVLLKFARVTLAPDTVTKTGLFPAVATQVAAAAARAAAEMIQVRHNSVDLATSDVVHGTKTNVL
jgi:hypothetical protein